MVAKFCQSLKASSTLPSSDGKKKRVDSKASKTKLAAPKAATPGVSEKTAQGDSGKTVNRKGTSSSSESSSRDSEVAMKTDKSNHPQSPKKDSSLLSSESESNEGEPMSGEKDVRTGPVEGGRGKACGSGPSEGKKTKQQQKDSSSSWSDSEEEGKTAVKKTRDDGGTTCTSPKTAEGVKTAPHPLTPAPGEASQVVLTSHTWSHGLW